MILIKSFAQKVLLLGFLFFSYISLNAQEGKQLFQSHCQTCHSLDKNLTGPALRGFLERGPWADKANLYAWIHNPAGFMAKDPYTQGLKQQFGVIMQAFPDLTTQQIDAIADYVATAPPPGGDKTTTTTTGAPAEDNSGRNAIIFGVISIVLAIVALILMQVNNNLKKLSDDKEGILRPEPVPFWRNKVYIALLALVFFIVGGYFVGKGAINLGRQQSYQPDQPIHYSHKVHAGINQINCLYCHGNAWESKHAAIPSLNICMNCHKAITTYEKGPKLYDEEGKEINGTAEIQKLHQYAGYEPGKPWDPSKAKPIEWVKIHNLPDHVFFSHAQHVNAGKVACQTCHGNIQEMDVVSQQAELSMGWCINCHRQTKVNFFNGKDSSGNKFYSIYEKFHNDIASGKMDSVTVKDIGGLECVKCHY
ncbi:c-type cytochrome [Flavisolibacter tropicus]|uniref:Cytochrome C n=1 Tax=Flavisolibacter tropicus TaxID=1492898 RepID=A0A172TY22_9BACT|nr:c-type cytochrome [Flavisolibacter tropicus]ANE51906.1 cytochrome C [Flavisolibacter tropicus]